MLDLDIPRAFQLGQLYEADVLVGAAKRRKTGAHYTPFELAKRVARSTLAPLLADARAPEDVYALSICDPAMGTGAFLLAAADVLADDLLARFGVDRTTSLHFVASRCLSGVDVDAAAVVVARRALTLLSGDASVHERRLVIGDALACPLGGAREEGEREVSTFFETRGAACPKAVHWESDIGRVDAFVGNPPFVGGKRIATTHGPAYASWLRRIHPDANGNMDLAAHFLRRAFDVLRPGGRMGFIVTNTIAQGDTRAGGLERILARGGEIVEATTREPWPGDAAVVTSFVHVRKPEAGAPRESTSALLDGIRVERITAYLRAGSTDARPSKRTMEKRAFIGCFVRGAGFTFDDASPRALSLAEMHEAIAKNARNRDVIHPYIGGEEVARHFQHAHHRYVIDLAGLTLDEARARHPELVRLLEKKARRVRESLGTSAVDRAHKERWWRFANERPELRRATKHLERVIVIPRVAAHVVVTFLPTTTTPSDQLVVIAKDDFGSLALLQSRVHEVWARAYSSTLGDGLRYTPSTCFETFPWPRDTHSLSDAGEKMYRHRAAWMKRRQKGLTAFYNWMTNPKEHLDEVDEARALHAEIDRRVLELYGSPDPRSGHRREDILALLQRAGATPR